MLNCYCGLLGITYVHSADLNSDSIYVVDMCTLPSDVCIQLLFSSWGEGGEGEWYPVDRPAHCVFLNGVLFSSFFL